MDELIQVRQYKKLKDNENLRKQAQAMYLNGEFYPTEIADYLSIDINELGLYVFGADKTGTSSKCWHYMKQNNTGPQWLEHYEAVKPQYIKKTESKLLKVANKIIDKLDDDHKLEDMETKDLVNVISAMDKIDKIGRLEEGKATSHTIQERTSFSLREIVASKAKVVDEEDIDDAKVIENFPTSRK